MMDETDFLISKRAKRANAGSRLKQLIELEEQADSAQSTLSSLNEEDENVNLLFQEDENDEEFYEDELNSSEEEIDNAEDEEKDREEKDRSSLSPKDGSSEEQVNSDEVLSESELSLSESDESEGEKELQTEERRKQKRTRKHIIPEIKRPSTRAPPKKKLKLALSDSLMLSKRSSSRSTVIKSKEALVSKLRANEERKAKMPTIVRQKEREPTQEERLEQAKETAKANTFSLQQFREQEFEKKEKQKQLLQSKKVQLRNILRLVSRVNYVSPTEEIKRSRDEYNRSKTKKRAGRRKKVAQEEEKVKLPGCVDEDLPYYKMEMHKKAEEAKDMKMEEIDHYEKANENLEMVQSERANQIEEADETNDAIQHESFIQTSNSNKSEEFNKTEKANEVENGAETEEKNQAEEIHSNEGTNQSEESKRTEEAKLSEESNHHKEGDSDGSSKEVNQESYEMAKGDDVYHIRSSASVTNMSDLTNDSRQKESFDSTSKGKSSSLPSDNERNEIIRLQEGSSGSNNVLKTANDSESGKGHKPINETVASNNGDLSSHQFPIKSEKSESLLENTKVSIANDSDTKQADAPLDNIQNESSNVEVDVDVQERIKEELDTYEGPYNKEVQNTVFFIDFEEDTNPDLKLNDVNIKRILFGSQSLLPASRRFRDLTTIIRIGETANPYETPKQKRDVLFESASNLSEDNIIFDDLKKLPKLGYAQEIEEEIDTDDKEMNSAIVIKTEAPAGLYLPNGNKKACLITGTEVRYFDPATGIPYSDVETYKFLKTIEQGNSAWYSMRDDQNDNGKVEIYLGRRDGTDRHAKGVPGGFSST